MESWWQVPLLVKLRNHACSPESSSAKPPSFYRHSRTLLPWRRLGRPNPVAVRLPQRDPVDDLEKRQGAGLDDVGVDGPAAEDLAVVFRLDVGLALGVLADRNAADVIVADLDVDAGDPLDGLEDRVHRAVADDGLAMNLALVLPETDGCRGDRAA